MDFLRNTFLLLTGQEGKYINGMFNGPYKEWYNDDTGKLFCEGIILKGKKEGVWKFWSTSGFVNFEAFYVSDVRHGIMKKYNMNKVCIQEHTLKDDIINGMCRFWYDDGQLKEEGVRIPKNKNDNKNDKDFNLDGVWKKWWANGQIRTERYFIDGKTEGVTKEWYSNGNLEEEGSYSLDKKTGPWKRWYSNGQLWNEGSYLVNNKYGVWKYWWENGQLESEGVFVNDKMHGVWTRWHPNGQQSEKGAYVHGEKEGVWKEWDPSGNLWNETTWVKGVCEKPYGGVTSSSPEKETSIIQYRTCEKIE